MDIRNFQNRAADHYYADRAAAARPAMVKAHRFLERAISLAKACGCTSLEAQNLVNYVFFTPPGEKTMETSETLYELSVLSDLHDLDLSACSELKLAAISRHSPTLREAFRSAG
jgi:hypothetical protein